MSASISPSDALAWFEKAKSYFTDFKPVPKSMMINYGDKTSSIGLALKIDEGFRKNHNKIKMPAYQGFEIKKMQDASFNQIRSLWKFVDNQWILDAKDLPPSDGYFIELEGRIDEKSLKDMVHIKPSVNRDSNDEADRYWLDASLKNPKKLEEIWAELEINAVDVGVKIDMNKMFGLKIPQQLKDKTDSIQRFLKAGMLGDRNKVYASMNDLKRQEQKTAFNPDDFFKIIQNLTARETLLDYVSVDTSYTIGNIDNSTKYEKLVPLDVKVQTLTTLTLKNPQSLGYLTLKRKPYLDKIEKEFNKILKKDR